ncbi:hypothetical protein B0H19DRAFT_1371417 [Mycena capillaripes]|nr:hypothetical protein B0H19DRAFT_1371417 [Mycena capillaripes]
MSMPLQIKLKFALPLPAPTGKRIIIATNPRRARARDRSVTLQLLAIAELKSAPHESAGCQHHIPARTRAHALAAAPALDPAPRRGAIQARETVRVALAYWDAYPAPALLLILFTRPPALGLAAPPLSLPAGGGVACAGSPPASGSSCTPRTPQGINRDRAGSPAIPIRMRHTYPATASNPNRQLLLALSRSLGSGRVCGWVWGTHIPLPPPRCQPQTPRLELASSDVSVPQNDDSLLRGNRIHPRPAPALERASCRMRLHIAQDGDEERSMRAAARRCCCDADTPRSLFSAKSTQDRGADI